MQLLLDTHTFLWFVDGDNHLSAVARALIEDENNEKFISIASIWEIAIKVSTGKLTITPSFEQRIPEQIEVNGFQIFSIETSHLAAVARLPFHHRDPFDRLLIAQSEVENFPLVSADTAFDVYEIDRLWN